MREFICGKNSVLDAIKSGLDIKAIYSTRPEELKTNMKVQKVDKNFLDKLTRENHQGFVAELTEFTYHELNSIFQDKPEKVLILDHVQDPRNLGAILRTANAAGVTHVVIPKDRAADVTASALKTASGGHVGLKVIKVNSLMDVVTKLKDNGFWVYATALENGKDMDTVTFNYPLAVIVGNEESGVSNTLIKHADERIFIKMNGTVQSLNVSVATGIVLFKI